MGIVDDALERADQEAFTREPPRSLKARINFLMKQLRTTKAVAREIGVSQRSVERYIKGERKHPPKAVSDRIDTAVRSRWQPRVRRRRQQQAADATGITVETRARFGYTAPVGTTDDGRMRRLTVHLPPPYARRLFDAQQQGADDARLRDIVAEGLQEIYFKDGGRRAQDLEVELTDVDYFDVSY
ncbi:XRE family transcriptional regulator [Streptomyces sp. NE06-03E]|uniref:XRE family transcriptional regulator n=1 Tax=Streptomyces sp. gb1(2016) TaxID=1828321 RepID=A0A652L652_9ACTN|nr:MULTISPECIES: XRE family transcriptional regulator [unclassified Streptomyces]WSS64785.1 XRE family transcriptional regulator [Streptomyces sp. NBC_01177]WSS71786.1 XRE family transcriptional regulator [Streptomyces sp. NBC_01175]WSS78791.1 XRE family transcriptional regulator [Streptomyces sp. NBC_01174]MDX3054331.1 XRE family transcriptional regulator [Streptomyces sp. NE06-03E]MDX3430734.1 XRE family transcriptional regulator [Streptomyces sp. ME01-18a]